MSEPVMFHVIYTRQAMLLSRRPYANWREIQGAFPDYVASLGPWNLEETVSYLAETYPELAPAAGEQVERLLSASATEIRLTFAEGGVSLASG